MSSDPFCSICIFGDWLDDEESAPISCRKCIILAQRPNFISIYRDGRRPKIPNIKSKKNKKNKSKGAQRISKLVRSASKKKRKVPPKKEEIWNIIVPEPPRKIEDPSTKLYKVMYRNKETGDWFYEVCTHDKIAPKEGYVVEDILDYIEV